MRAMSPWAALVAGLLVGLPAGPGVAGAVRGGSGRAPGRAARPASAQGIRAFVSVPVWYVDYEVTIDAHSPNGDTQLHSVVRGRVALDMRTPGPTLSSAVDPANGGARVAEIGDGATWMVQPPVQAGSDVVSDARFKAYTDSIAPTQTITYTVKRAEYTVDARGAGRPLIGGIFMFDANVGTKKWALSLPVVFSDTEKTVKAVVGDERRFVFDHWETSRFERGLGEFFSSYEYTPEPQNTGNALVMRGALPDSLAALSAQQAFQIKNASYVGTLTQRVTISPFPVQPIELVIHEPAGYKDWRPMGLFKETEIGATIAVRSTLQKVGGGAPPFKAVRIHYKLVNTSRVPGVCMNWPRFPAAPSPPDFVIPAADNGDLMIDDDEFQEASDTRANMVESSVVLGSRDYGGYTTLQVTAELENGDVVIGKVEGTNGETALRVPSRPVDSHVAFYYLDRYNVAGEDDKDDDDDDPAGDHFKGDGLTLYEEYRGFIEGGAWIETDPTTKDLFVLNTMRSHGSSKKGIALFAHLSGLEVHSDFTTEEFGSGSVLNLHHEGEAHVVDQHGIIIRPRFDATDAARVENVGTPKSSKAVNIPPGWTVGGPGCVNVAGQPVDYFAVTIAHEMFHAVNVYHHGEMDQRAVWTRSQRPDGTESVTETRNGRNMGIIQIRTEGGQPVPPADVFEAGKNSLNVSLGMPHCQHSGAEECVMRYDCATAYVSDSDPQVRYVVDEHVGDQVCHSSVGTGVNAAGRHPQPRYSNAAAADPAMAVKMQRGDCAGQVRVSDVGQAPER